MDNLPVNKAQWRAEQLRKIQGGCSPCTRIPLLTEVDTVVSTSLDCLEKPRYRIEREQRGEAIYYTVYKQDAYLGTYIILPGAPGGSIQCSTDPDLAEEWENIWMILIWGNLQRAFGKFPWPEQGVLPKNIIADNLAGTVTYTRNEQGQVELSGGAVNPGYIFEIGDRISFGPTQAVYREENSSLAPAKKGGRPSQPGYDAAYNYMIENGCSIEEAEKFWTDNFNEHLSYSYDEKHKVFYKAIMRRVKKSRNP
jgi:hypothetical protein